ncbi:hypothetical protein [Candidatus Methanodesulfokora washburnensis]|jgi:hypothetical protein|uniref:Uncharacterized protein n=1 Tax=Candidatus Methanodesulfokora washburnensis TaxID=2478471 RepID=A0A3R9PE78_9CREN|nr:hypothetical protein [Candidatus Methanodesulfokores washburnensis]RSN73999.1 hypothetical protein D6D85_09095 [Candidatus Methanodesulfokores washburnensis]
MVTEPIEAIIAILLISIVLYSVFVYNQRGTENIMLMRTLSKSIAGTIAGMYANYINSSIDFYTFNNTVNSFLEYTERKENVSIAANITVILKNGTLRTARLRQMSRPVKRSIIENITVSLANESRNLTVYALPNRSYVYCNLPPLIGCTSWRSIGIYVVGYYSDGTPATSGSASVTDVSPPCFSVSGPQDIQNGIALLELSPKTGSCSGTVTITVNYNINGKSGSITLQLPVQLGSGKNFQLESEPQCNNQPCYFYFLGEQINLTPQDSTLNWLVNNSARGYYEGSGWQIITGSGLCSVTTESGLHNLPCYIFFTPGPYNLSMNSFPGSYNGWDTNQPFFIEPYFTIITVRVGFNR